MRAADSTTDPAFVVDANARIHSWNAAARAVLGRGEPEVLGKLCWKVLRGQDIFGNRYCSEGCPLLSMARDHRATNRCLLRFPTAAGGLQTFSVSTLVVPGDGDSEKVLLHLLGRPPARDAGDGGPALASPADGGPLTAREVEVLRLLADGKRSRQIAQRLCVSPVTVRNHVQHIFHKLDVHSRLEAVSVARRSGLI